MATTRKAKQTIKEKAMCDKCILCESAALPGHRGLCAKHYNLFNVAKRAKKTQRERDRFDRETVAAGLIRDSRRGRRAKEVNPFIRTA